MGVPRKYIDTMTNIREGYKKQSNKECMILYDKLSEKIVDKVTRHKYRLFFTHGISIS